MSFLSSLFGGDDHVQTSTSQSTTASNSNSYNQTIGNGGALLESGAKYDASTTNSTSILDTSIHDSSNRSTNWWDDSTHTQITDNSTRDNSQRWTDNSTTDNRSSFSLSDSSSRDNSQHWADYSTTDNSNRSTFSLSDSSSRDTSQHWTDNSTTDNSNRSTFSLSDSSSRDNSQHWADNSQTTITNTGTDAAQITALNTALLQAVNEKQGDTVQLIARLGADTLSQAGKSATDLYATSSSEATKAWGQTLDAASSILDKLMTNTRGAVTDTLAAAQTVATRSVDSAPVSAGQTAATSGNYALLAVACVAVAALVLIRKP